MMTTDKQQNLAEATSYMDMATVAMAELRKLCASRGYGQNDRLFLQMVEVLDKQEQFFVTLIAALNCNEMLREKQEEGG
jgi:hypothetical protein